MSQDIREFFKPKAKKHSRIISSDDDDDEVKVVKEVKLVDPTSFFSQTTVKQKPRNVTNKLNEKTFKALNEPQIEPKELKSPKVKPSNKVKQEETKQEEKEGEKKPKFKYIKYNQLPQIYGEQTSSGH
jgi:hypothetical protein